MLTLDRTKFTNWLASHNPDDIVGYTSCFTRCPLSQFLSQSGIEAKVTQNDVLLGKEMVAHPLDDWAKKFVRLVDSSVNYDEDGTMHVPVSARQALDFLSQT